MLVPVMAKQPVANKEQSLDFMLIYPAAVMPFLNVTIPTERLKSSGQIGPKTPSSPPENAQIVLYLQET